MTTATISRTFGNFSIDDVTSAPLQVTKSVRLASGKEEVFDFLANHLGWTEWFPILSGVQLDNRQADVDGGSGAVRTCTLVNGAVFSENIVGFERPHRFGYAIEAGNPLGVEQHLAVVEVADNGDQTVTVSWYQFFDHPNLEEMKVTVDEALSGAFDNLQARFN
ncbi:MAG: SRPBCC family protein [Ardenticatenaceae bacterium]|nr:SRPBCC family protein [Ardenticatenaceae bacterium]